MAKKKEKKEKKAGKRMSKKELAALLIDFFHAKSSETLSMKYIFHTQGLAGDDRHFPTEKQW